MPNITGSWSRLTESDFTMLHPRGGFLHFRDRFRDVAHMQLITYRDPMTRQDTGESVRATIEAQALAHGWPLIGIYISGASQSAPHFAVHRSQFPSNPPKKVARLQTDLDAALEGIYKDERTIDDPTDPDYGQTFDVRSFWVNTHVFRYDKDGLYVQGDFVFQVSNNQPRPEWWRDWIV